MPTSLGSSLQKYIDYYRYVERSLTEEKKAQSDMFITDIRDLKHSDGTNDSHADTISNKLENVNPINIYNHYKMVITK